VLPRHSTSRPAYRDIHDQMISGGACRALFGDPSYVPFEKAAKDPFAVETKADADGLAVTWTGDGGLGPYWGPVDVYRAGGTWTHRIVYRCEVERDVAASLRSFRVLSVTKDGQPLAYDYPTAALESWGGKVRVHGMLILPTADPKDRPLWGAKAYEAKFAFGR
jgi:hypothetical protein